MLSTMVEIGVAILMVAVGIALVVWFARGLAAASQKRMMNMLARAGADPEVAAHGDTDPIMREVRSRCRKCQLEDLCDRWLAGSVEGDNDFCPNAEIFRGFAGSAARIAR